MKAEERLEQLAEQYEKKAQGIRIALEALQLEGRARAGLQLNAKLKSAAALRNGLTPEKRPKGLMLARLLPFLADGPRSVATLDKMLHEHGTDLRGVGGLVQSGFVKLAKGQYRLTPKGRARAKTLTTDNGANRNTSDDPFPNAKALSFRSRPKLKAYAIARVLEDAGKALPIPEIESAVAARYKLRVRGQVIASATRHGYIAKAPNWTNQDKTYVFVSRPELALRA